MSFIVFIQTQKDKLFNVAYKYKITLYIKIIKINKRVAYSKQILHKIIMVNIKHVMRMN